MSHPASALLTAVDVHDTSEGSAKPASVVCHLAHELRQPLSTIESIAYYLRLALPEDEAKLRPHVNKLAELVDLANWLVADAVHYLQAAPACPHVLDIHELLETELLDAEAADGAWCCVRLECESALIQIDSAQAQHLLRNIVTMARRMKSPSAQVYLQAWKESSWWVVQLLVADVQYSREQLRLLFEPFAAHAPAASGLGLATGRRIAEANGGLLEANPADGHGTLLSLRLPLAS
jgi:signal transduction histidine kinase